MDFDRIAASAPVNSLAARQTGAGEAWEPRVKLQDYFADMPPLKRIDAGCRRNAEWIDFRGMTFGRLTVVGVLDKASDGPASWVCRCQCGGYCTRRAKSLRVAMRGGNSFITMCGRCYYQTRLRDGWSPNLKLQVKA